MPFVCGELSSIVPVRIVKPDIQDEATSMTRPLTVKYKKPANCFICRNLTSATLPVHPLRNCSEQKRNERGGIASFSKFPGVISKIIDKTPIGYAFVRRLARLVPVSIVTSSRPYPSSQPVQTGDRPLGDGEAATSGRT